jgi:NACalpha-BTF3-like transcription factor
MCRERELAAVKVRQEDVEVIMAEAEVDRKLADRRLRECNASLVDALRTFL